MSSGLPERLRTTLGLHLAGWYAGLFIAGALGLFGLSYLLLARSLEQRDREAVRLTLATYASEYRTSGPVGLWRTLEAQEALGAHEDLFVRAFDSDGGLAFLSLPGRWAAFDLGPPRVSPPRGTYVWQQFVSSVTHEVLEVASLTLDDGAVLQVGRSTRARRDVLRRFRDLLGMVLAATVAVGLLGGLLLTRRALRPLRDLARTLGEIVGTGRLHARVPAREGGDALDELVRLVNALLGRIESLVAAMHGSLDAVAHDLRTPLMRLRVAAGRALTTGANEEGCREALSDCLEETDRVQSMLDSLMDISEAEAGVMALKREAVSVSSLFEEAVDLFSDLAEEKGIALRVGDAPSLSVHADRARVLQALANLVDNALKYTPAGGEVTLEARASGPLVEITVSDTGRGISTADLPHVFERLFRGDRSRSERGLGLGLSLVRAIALAHGGTVSVDSAPGHGARFALRLPAAGPA
jgi:signal transduction histidine kinase